MYQHRCHLFMFYVSHSTARLIRFDSVGVVITEPVDLDKDSDKLFEFFWRIRNASDVELGLDPTATMLFRELGVPNPNLDALDCAISDEELQKLSDTRPRTAILMAAAFRASRWPLYKLQVPDKNDAKKNQSFLVRNPSMCDFATSGRLTTGYIAFYVEGKSFCFLKDYWRPDSPKILSELSIYKILERHNIPGIATVLCGGDLVVHHDKHGVPVYQHSRTQELPTAESQLRRIHTRIVLREVGIPLEQYFTGQELCIVLLFGFNGECLVLIADCDIRLIAYRISTLGSVREGRDLASRYQRLEHSHS